MPCRGGRLPVGELPPVRGHRPHPSHPTPAVAGPDDTGAKGKAGQDAQPLADGGVDAVLLTPRCWTTIQRESIGGQGGRSPEGSGWAVRLGYRQCVAALHAMTGNLQAIGFLFTWVLGLGEGGVWLYRRWTQPITPDR